MEVLLVRFVEAFDLVAESFAVLTCKDASRTDEAVGQVSDAPVLCKTILVALRFKDFFNRCYHGIVGDEIKLHVAVGITDYRL